jgi:hypothetical protein
MIDGLPLAAARLLIANVAYSIDALNKNRYICDQLAMVGAGSQKNKVRIALKSTHAYENRILVKYL